LGDNAGLMSAWLRHLCLAVLTAVLLCAAPARAQDKPVDPKAAAKEHYTRGTSFYDLGRYDDAIKEFEAAYELKNDPAFLYNLAQSYRQAGKHEQAVHFYKTYLRYVPKPPNKADIEEKIKAEEQLLAQQGSGTTPPPTTTTPPPGNEPPVVTVPPANNPPPTTLPPGYAPPPAYTGPPAAAATADPGRKFRIAGVAAGGVGVVLVAIGIYEFSRAASASDEIEGAARAGQAFDPAVQDRGHSAQTAQWVLYPLGALAIAGGVGLFFYGRHVTAAETTTWRVSFAPTLAPHHGGSNLRITF
jgi:tetratricopeptide (TPR) repeat protein